MTNLEAYEKVDTTICLNSNKLEFNIDKAYHEDCFNDDDLLKCLDILRDASITLDIIKNFVKYNKEEMKFTFEIEIDDFYSSGEWERFKGVLCND